MLYRGFVLVADTDARAAELEQAFLPAPLRFLLHGPTPSAAQLASAGPAAYGLGRMLFAGSPDTVVARIGAFAEATGVGVLDLIFSSGQTEPGDVQRSIELFGREVLPRIRHLSVRNVIE